MKKKEKIEKEDNKFKKIFLQILKIIVIWAFCCVIGFVIFAQICNLIFGIENIESYWFALIFLLSVIIATIITVLLFKNKKKYTVFKNTKWLKFSFCVILTLAFIGSLKSDVEIDLIYAKELLGFEWTIFSLTIALFLAWYIVVEKYLKNEPLQNEKGDKRVENIAKKLSFYHDSYSYLLNGILLFVNFVCISGISGLIWINQKISLFVQNCLYFNFFLTINTIQILFSDILIPVIARLLVSRRYKMTDDEIGEELILATVEQAVEDYKNQLEKEQIDGQTIDEDGEGVAGEYREDKGVVSECGDGSQKGRQG